MRNTEKFNPSSYLRRNLVLKTKCLSALCPYHYSYQKLKTKITESIVPKRATYSTRNLNCALKERKGNLGDVFQFSEFESETERTEENGDERRSLAESVQANLVGVVPLGKFLKRLCYGRKRLLYNHALIHLGHPSPQSSSFVRFL